MYSYEWDAETGGLILNSSPLSFSKEPRPVYYKELDILGFDKYWNYDKDDTYPYMWAEANNYWYCGRQVAKTKGGSLYTAPEIILMEEPEPDGQPLRFIDIPAMVEKNRVILESLTQETIRKVYNTFVEYRNKVDVFYVAFSGGKDSVVALDIVSKALPHNEFKVLFGDTGMEFPDTYKAVDQTEKSCQYEGIEFLRSHSELSPRETWNIFGPPSQTMRWCCSVHKTAPQILLLRDYTGNPHFRGMAFTGIRGDESASRSEYDDVSLGEKVRGQYSCHPILEWNSAELFIYIYSNNLGINAAYKKGNSRAGCLVCPLAAYKNMFFKEISYNQNDDGFPTTSMFNDIILKTTSKELNSKPAINEFMNIAGWKARRSGKELSIAKNNCVDILENGIFTIIQLEEKTDWKEWIKTLGEVNHLENGDIQIEYQGKLYVIHVSVENGCNTFKVPIDSSKRNDILFMSSLKVVFRKASYCIKCRVCEANCPHGYIDMDINGVKINDKCVKCRKCHDVFHGCLVADSLRLPKGEKKMGSVDRYGNMGIEFSWVKKYFESKDEFWDSAHGLGTNKVKNLRSFLGDTEIAEKNKFTHFGEVIDRIGINEDIAWALISCNWVYSSEFNWWIKNIASDMKYTPEAIIAMLDEGMSDNSKSHVASAYKNIFISNPHLSKGLEIGICDYEEKNGKRFMNTATRGHWTNPDPRVILYSLYKFAEACGDYYQFTLTRLLNHDIDSNGVSPTEIFGLERDEMEKVLNGLTVNYPDFIHASFTLGLDNITLREEKTSKDVLELF